MLLQIDGLTVRHPRANHESSAAAVEQVSLSMPAGHIGVLVGPSGCGKTSLLRAVAGLERAAEGRVTIDNVVLSDAGSGVHVPPEQRRIGMVFQDHALFPHLSVADNVAFGIHLQPRRQRLERVQRMLQLVGLNHAAGRAPHQLSGGQQQRVALARALAPSPRLLLLDEPFSSLDVDLRERLAQEVHEILKTNGSTALVVTHDQMEAFALGDDIGVMNHGRLEQWDDAYSLYHRPATRFVASFIGHGVFAPASLLQALDCPLPPSIVDDDCDILLRADDIVHDDESPVKARIERKAFRGAEFLYTLRLKGGEQVLALVPSHHDHAVGEWIGIRPAVDHVVTFASIRPKTD